MPTRVLYDSVSELQRCMAPLMCLSGDEIVEGSLFEPAGEEHRTSSTPEEEAYLQGEEPMPLETPKASSLPECPEIPEPTEPLEQIDTQSGESTEQTDALSAYPHPSPAPQPSHHSSMKKKKPQREIGADPYHANEVV